MKDLRSYRETMRRRAGAERWRRSRRKRAARVVAMRAATRLKEHFGASRVVVFGSVAAEHTLHAPADVDLAAWGLTPAAHLEAVAHLQACSPDFSIDLVRMEHCPPALRDVILKEGRLL